MVRAASGGAYAHSVAVTADGGVWTWGMGEYGALGHGDLDKRATPTRIAALGADSLAARKAIASASGFKHTLVLLDDGSVVAFGDNLYSQISHGSRCC